MTSADDSAARVGRYRIERKLGAGGMGEIYAARVEGYGGFEKRVVVKMLLPEMGSRPEHVQAFFDEARIAATLDHSNIVQVIDVGLADGRAYLAMEFLDGWDLAALLTQLDARGERVPDAQAVAIAASVARALEHAHEQLDAQGASLEIVHRDVSPSNVFVTREGVVKVIDFGIARARDKISRTTIGTVKGKLEYMSPEQCRGEQVDRRSDVFSLGVVMYEMIAGRRPHRGADDYEVRKAIVEGGVEPLHACAPDLPEAIADLVMRALQKDPANRWPSCGQLADELISLGRAARFDLSGFGLAELAKGAFASREQPKSSPASEPVSRSRSRPAGAISSATASPQTARSMAIESGSIPKRSSALPLFAAALAAFVVGVVATRLTSTGVPAADSAGRPPSAATLAATSAPAPPALRGGEASASSIGASVAPSTDSLSVAQAPASTAGVRSARAGRSSASTGKAAPSSTAPDPDAALPR